MSNLLEKKYVVIKNILSKELAEVYYNYVYRRRDVYATLKRHGFINPFTEDYGWEGDHQTQNTFNMYGDVLFDNMMLDLKSRIEKETDLKLSEMYTYWRIYSETSELKRHKDRGSCEISGTINLGGTPWPIYIDPNPKNGYYETTKKGNVKYIAGGERGVEVLLEPGDCMIYTGKDCEHWREPLMEGECAQVFTHYRQTKDVNEEDKFDRRLGLGMPAFTKRDK